MRGVLLTGGHAVTIVGWGADKKGTPYWVMQNSYGKGWKDQVSAHFAYKALDNKSGHFAYKALNNKDTLHNIVKHYIIRTRCCAPCYFQTYFIIHCFIILCTLAGHYY